MRHFSPAFSTLFSHYMSPELSEQLSFILSFSLVTGLFILFADLTPKRIGMIAPEAVAFAYHQPDALLPVRFSSPGVVV
ncbi:membrane protein [Salmonella bongori]|nr:membrane protein [Salmonella bongori]